MGYNIYVSSVRFGGVLFVAFANDHPPRHVHGFEAVVDLRIDGGVALSKRRDAVQPGNAKRSDVKKILTAAALHFEELVALWEEMHGET